MPLSGTASSRFDLAVQAPPTSTEDCNHWIKDHSISEHPISLHQEHQDIVAVIGVGYVGTHLIESFASKYRVIGYDVSLERLRSLQKLVSSYPSVSLTTDQSRLHDATHFLIAVPTNILPDGCVDTTNLVAAIRTVQAYARSGTTVVIESSVSVGMTRALLGSLARNRHIKAGMSPERIDPGRTQPPARSIPKIISALEDICPGSLESIHKLYSKAFDIIVPVSKPEVAEMMKLYENCQRMIGIAYANEMADACLSHDIDPFEVTAVAATKPFGYMPFTPGLGVGGPCIPVNPYYLFANNNFPLLEKATEHMRRRPERIAKQLMAGFKGRSSSIRILVVGIGFKAGQSHLGNSPAVALIEALQNVWCANVSFADPLVDQSALPHVPKFDERTQWRQNELEKFDLIVLATRQERLNLSLLDCLNVKVERFIPR